MVVEALYELSDSRGSSQLATVNWLKSSHYGWMAAPDEARFKANVASGIKQVAKAAARFERVGDEMTSCSCRTKLLLMQPRLA